MTLEQYYIKERERLVKRFSRRAGSPENAEDIVQEAFTRALKYWDTYDPTRKDIGPWFNTIMNNALRDFKRDERNYGMCEEFVEEQYDGLEMSQIHGGMLEKIKTIIEAKEEPLREILHLYYIKEYKPSEIVQVTDLENSYIRKNVWRFREELKETFA